MRESRATIRLPGLRIEARVGAGAHGEVFRAREPETGRCLAVKVSHPGPSGTPDDAAFRLEYQLHRSFRHPHILRAHAFGELDAKRRYYTMDFVDAAPLRAAGPRRDLARLAEMTIRLCEALAYAHGQGVLHGDLKTSNILAPANDPEGLRLADFGHARPIGEREGPVTGTLATIAPERLLGWPADIRCDLYSIGVVLFEALSGRLPWSAENARDLVQQMTDGPAPSVAPWAGDDARWTTLVDDLLAVDPARRPASAEDVADRLAVIAGRKPRRRAAAVASVLPSPLQTVGRADELRSALEQVGDRGGVRTLLVTGVERVGKTRFADDLARTAELAGIDVLLADARPEDGSVFRLLRRVRHHGVVRDLLREGGQADEPPSRHDPAPALHEREARLARLVEVALAQEGGLERERLLVFDSVEVADLDSLAFLEALQLRLSGTKATLCVVARSAEAAADPLAALRREPIREIRLAPFGAGEVREFVLALLPGGARRARALDEEPLDRLVERLLHETGGVPGAIESRLRHWVRSGRVTRRADGWAVDTVALARDEGPRTSRSLAIQGLRAIPPRLRPLLRLAAIAGREFDATLLADPTPRGQADIAEFLAQAIRRDVLDRSRAGASRLTFRNPDTARALADGLAPEARRAAHALLARRLGERDPSGAHAADRGIHLERAGDAVAARAAYAAAGERAAAARAFHEAGRLFRTAYELHDPAARRRLPAFAVTWVRCLFLNGHFDEAEEVAQSLMAKAEDTAEGDARALHLSVLRAMALSTTGRSAVAQRCIRGVLREPRLADHAELHAWALTEYGRMEMERGHSAPARRAFEQARDIALAAKLKAVAGRTELCLGMLDWRSDDAEAALAWHRRAQAHLMDAGAQELMPAVWGNQAICRWFLLEPRQSAELHRRAAEGYLAQRRRAEAARSYQNLAHVLTESGRFAEADEALAAADDLNRSLRAPRQESYFEYHQARLSLYRGRIADARLRIERAISLAEGLRDDFVVIGHGCLQGLIELDAGRPDAARETASRCLTAAEAIPYRWGVAKANYILGRAEMDLGNPEEGLDHLATAARVASSARQPVVSFRVEIARAEALAAAGQDADARAALAAARTLEERSESRLWAGLLHLAEGKVELHGGAPEAASAALARAYEAFVQLEAERLRAETLGWQSRAFAARGNASAAASAATHARSLARTLGVPAPADLAGGTESGSGADVARVLDAATSIARSLATVQGLDALLERVLDVAITHLGCERGVVALIDPVTGRPRVRCARNIDHESVLEGLEISWSALRNAGSGDAIVHTGDALAEPALSGRESIRRARIRSLIAIPIRLGDRVLGSLYLDHRGLAHLFGPTEREFARFIADVAALGIHNAQELELRDEQVRNLRGELEDDALVLPRGFVAKSPAVRAAVREGVRAARDGRVVLITGPTGTGKDRLARVIHEACGQKGEFVDCALTALSETLFESEIFGVARGAATMVSERPGFVETAHGGTLFLNEIGDLSPSLQPKLLHFLDHRRYRRVGAPELRTFDGVILCATNADLERNVAAGTFREDLYHRLAECVIALPPLRERRDDIPALVELFLAEIASRSGREAITLHPRAHDLLRRAEWSGNVRELRAAILRAVDRIGRDGVLRPEHLDSPSLRTLRESWQAGRATAGIASDEEIRRIHQALVRCGGIVLRAAQMLGVHESTLRRHIRKYRLEHLAVQSRGRPRQEVERGAGPRQAGRAKRATPSA